jgi:hypothetical protein
MRTYHEKEASALALVEQQLATARNPIVLCSFGKDSIVLLHLCLRVRKVPVMFFRFAKFHEKHTHALSVMQQWDLEAYDMWPAFMRYYQSGSFFEVLHSYPTGPRAFIHLFSGIRARHAGETRYLCAVDDLLQRPTLQGVEYPWDVTFHGHKGTDDPELGESSPIVNPVSQLGNTRLVVPFTDWTDEDIWTYIKHYDLPYDHARYDAKQEASSPDKYPTCYRCLDGDYRGALVTCPKTNTFIPNIAVSAAQHESLRQELVSSVKYCEVIGAPRTTPNDAHL